MAYKKAVHTAIDIATGASNQLSFLDIIGFGRSYAPINIGLITYKASQSRTGGFVPGVIGQGLAIGPGLLLAAAVDATITLIPGVGPILAPWVSGFIGLALGSRLGRSLSPKIRLFTDLHKNVRHLEMGGAYQDSEIAQRQRFIAIQDMSSAMIPSRRYLGQEALLMHR